MPQAPQLERRCVCVVDDNATDLTAVMSSYLFRHGFYLPVFIFPIVIAPKMDEDRPSSDAYMSNSRAIAAATFINNAWARMRGSEYLILAGLSPNQKSFLSIPSGTKVIEITKLSDVEAKLSELGTAHRQVLNCRPSDLLKGLFLAQKEGKVLVLDPGADELPSATKNQGGGIVVVEDNRRAAAVIAVNYASSVNANVMVVPAVGKGGVKKIQRSIQKWKEEGDLAAETELRDTLKKALAGETFSGLEYATFFTEGAPYSLILENVIPCSYVNLAIRPDLFLFNSIIFEQIGHVHSAVVFSPQFFVDEETHWLTDFFPRQKYYLRQLIGQHASFNNFDFTVQHFPYAVLHICSHGGEVDGWEVSEEFIDRHGTRHVIEYDEVVGINSVPDKDGRFAVHRKTIFRRLDGFAWMSEELEKQNLPSYVFHDLWNALYRDQANKINPNAKRTKKSRIAASCAIRCSDSIHQGELNIAASHSSPLIFNNTCWSWFDVGAFFLSCGAKGYIGTLWAIGNDAAVSGARVFYEHLFSGTVLSAFHKAIKAIEGTDSKNIYIYWGLHFTTLPPANNTEQSRSEVFQELLFALGGWVHYIQTTRSAEGRHNAVRVLSAIFQELDTNFSLADLEKLQQEMQTRIETGFRSRASPGGEMRVPISARRSIDHPTECKILDAVSSKASG